MLMITTVEDAEGLKFRLEGQLSGDWVRELATTWSLAIPGLLGKPVWVDLAGLTYIDAEGFAMLTLMARHGATIVAPGSLNQDLVEEIRMSLLSES